MRRGGILRRPRQPPIWVRVVVLDNLWGVRDALPREGDEGEGGDGEGGWRKVT